LEQKLDNLVTLLTSSQTAASNQNQLPQSQASTVYSALPSDSPAQISSVPSLVSDTSPAVRPSVSSLSKELTDTGNTPSIVTDKHPTQQAPTSHSLPLVSDEETYLETFRTQMAGYFPFVVIDKGISARDLKKNKPFLFKTVVMAGSYKDVGRQAALGKEVAEYLSRRVLVEGEKNLDLLQGLLVYLSWYGCSAKSSIRLLY